MFNFRLENLYFILTQHNLKVYYRLEQMFDVEGGKSVIVKCMRKGRGFSQW